MGKDDEQDEIFKNQVSVIRQLADKQSCIVVGRCSDYILREREDSMHVFIYASYEHRMKNCVESLGMTEAKAIAVSIFEYDEEREKEKLRKEEYEAGQKNGIEQGCKAEQERFKCLSEKMQADQRIEELLRATTDLEYRDKLYLEYDIPEEKYALK